MKVSDLLKAKRPGLSADQGELTTRPSLPRLLPIPEPVAPVDVQATNDPPSGIEPDDETPTPEAVAAVQQAADKGKTALRAQAAQQVASSLRVFTDQRGAARLAVSAAGGRVDVLYADSDAATDYVRAALAKATEQAVTKQAGELAISQARDRARQNQDVRTVHIRLARPGGGTDPGDPILLDLARLDGSVVVIDPSGYRVAPQGDTLFDRGSGTGQLPQPLLGMAPHGAMQVLRAAFADWGVDPTDHLLLAALLCEYLRPGTAKPILQVVGPAGARKSTLARQFVSLFDPAPGGNVPTQRMREEDLMAAVSQRYALHMDNLSSLAPDDQDLLCRVATGGSFAHRKLYEQHAVASATLQNPMVLTAITPVITRTDARSRTVTVRLRPSTAYRSDEDLRRDFDDKHAERLGAACALLAAAIALLPAVKAQGRWTHRMVDFEQMGEAVAQSVGEPAGSFSALLAGRRRDEARDTGAEDFVVSAIVDEAEARIAEALAAGGIPTKAPAARVWADRTGGTGWAVWQGADGSVIAAFVLAHLLTRVQGAELRSGELAPPWRGAGMSSERKLRHAIEHRMQTFADLGWLAAFDKFNDRGGFRLTRRPDAESTP